MCAYAMLASMSVSILVFAVFYQLNQLPTPVAVQPAEVITLISPAVYIFVLYLSH